MLKPLLLLVLFSLPLTVSAHSPSSSYLFIDQTENESQHLRQLKLRWDIALRDLETVIGLDSNLDQKISWQELKQKRQDITAYAYSHLSLQRAKEPCRLNDTGLQVTRHTDGAYAVLHIQPECNAKQGILTADYSLLFAEDTNHRGIILDQRPGKSGTTIASPENARFNLDERKSGIENFMTFVMQGIWHILIGFDHILFVITLMLPAVLLYRNSQWSAVSEFRPAFMDLLKVVTAFTIAHSITLSLAILEIVSLPSRWVESAIALSVILVAVNNIKPLFIHARLSMAFLFGLVHGFGFASVLNDLNLTHGSLVLSLLGFNLGVEIGQALILLLLFPAAYLLRKTALYQAYILKGGSLLISILASVWLFQRVVI